MHSHIHHLFNELNNALRAEAAESNDLRQIELTTIASEVDGLQHDYAEAMMSTMTTTPHPTPA